MTTTQTALDRYNRLFDNAQYNAVADRVATDLRVERDTVRVSDAANLVTDTALSLCQHPHYTDAWLKLATFCGQNAITMYLSGTSAPPRYRPHRRPWVQSGTKRIEAG